jgi:hypothetical protein
MTKLLPARVPPMVALRITAGLAFTGAAFGALSGMVALGIGMLAGGYVTSVGDLTILLLPGAFGAVLGSFLAPLAGWFLLRRVPLGRAFAGLAAGTLLGGLAGWFLFSETDPMIRPIQFAVVGFLLAATALRVTHRRNGD